MDHGQLSMVADKFQWVFSEPLLNACGAEVKFVSCHRPTPQPRLRSRTVQTAAVGVSVIVRIPGAHRGMGCGAARLWAVGAVEACTRGRRSRLAVRVSSA